MNIIIIGCGKVGSKFAQVLAEEGHDVVIVDNDSSSFKALKQGLNIITITGVPFDKDVLKHAGIENADAFAAVTPDDNVNIMACQVAKEIFKVPRVMARIYNPEREHIFHEFGLDTICPTNLTVDIFRTKILREVNTMSYDLCGEAFKFKHEEVKKQYIGYAPGEIELKDDEMVFGIVRDGEFFFADKIKKLQKDDELIIANRLT
ncbi:MAG: NAD(P)-binding domain-containing protein [Clostridiales bacterium]|nr:NAD(P)-binding domain-containing protein [Clostridiales bacterium]